MEGHFDLLNLKVENISAVVLPNSHQIAKRNHLTLSHDIVWSSNSNMLKKEIRQNSENSPFLDNILIILI